MDWEIFPLPLNEKFVAALQPDVTEATNGIFFKGSFDLTVTGDTYFDLHNYSKGVLYINGHNLGRYWNLGPQQRLYCPAAWLKKGKNEMLVFDLHQRTAAPVSGMKSL